MRLLRKQRTYALLLLTVLILLFAFSESIAKILYPIHYKQEISRMASKYNVDPLLIAAIIRVESNYRSDGISKKGASGVMQLMPDTAKWVRESGRFDISYDSDNRPVAYDIEMGTWYMNWLLNYYDGNLVASIAAYNAGQGNVNKWRSSGLWDGTRERISNIPFGETRHYIQRVLYYYQKYRDIYDAPL